jgi:hypothetical protein
MRTVDQGTAGIRTDILDHHDHPTARWAADVLGVSGRAMLAALVRGERDPHMLAELAKGRLRTKLPQLRQALRGRFRDITPCWCAWPLGTWSIWRAPSPPSTAA